MGVTEKPRYCSRCGRRLPSKRICYYLRCADCVVKHLRLP